MDSIVLLIAPVFLLLLWGATTYNGLVRLRNHCRESWSDIDAELKRRHDLIPALVETVKNYAAHEQRLFGEISQARRRADEAARSVGGAGSAGELSRAEGELARGIRQVLVVSEAYPELRASHHFLHLQRELVNTEDRIQAARRFYNANVRDLNNRVESIPSNLVARLAGIGPAEYFELEALGIVSAPPPQPNQMPTNGGG